MTPTEIGKLGRKIAAVCPAQKFNEETPKAWAALLGWVDYDDALAALYALGQEQQFIAPSDIIRQVKRARRDRLRTRVVPAPTNPDDAAGYRRQLRRFAYQVANPPAPGRLALTSGPDEVTARRAAQLRAAGGGQVVDPGAAPKTPPASVREALAEARGRCEEGARQYRGEDPLRKRWTPPADPSQRRGDLAPLSEESLRTVVDALPGAPRARSNQR
ncbi:hypothetical protein [Nocardiopsis sp. LOL_012]|uniref:hypothetical protein n=1 Tax=Nocardiopsis sp. LOL_012 TaxID=3345409 RepID=UPI003A89F064